MHGELLEAERGETLHMVEVVRDAAEARAALQACEVELAQWREAAEGARASESVMVIELEARREAEAEQAAARAELRAEQLRLRQANAQMHALLGRLRARLGEGDEAPEAWEGAAPSGLGSPCLSRGASPRRSSSSPRWGGSSSPPRWGGGGSPLSVPSSPRGVERAPHAPPPTEAWGAPPGSGSRGCGCGAAPGHVELGAAAVAAEASSVATAAAAAAGHGGAGGAAGRAGRRGRRPKSVLFSTVTTCWLKKRVFETPPHGEKGHGGRRAACWRIVTGRATCR